VTRHFVIADISDTSFCNCRYQWHVIL